MMHALVLQWSPVTTAGRQRRMRIVTVDRRDQRPRIFRVPYEQRGATAVMHSTTVAHRSFSGLDAA